MSNHFASVCYVCRNDECEKWNTVDPPFGVVRCEHCGCLHRVLVTEMRMLSVELLGPDYKEQHVFNWDVIGIVIEEHPVWDDWEPAFRSLKSFNNPYPPF